MSGQTSPAGRQQVIERAELLSFISHELRTPLTSVIGYAEVLLGGDTGDLTAAQTTMLERIATNGARVVELVEALLSAAVERNHRGGDIDVSDVLREAVESTGGAEGLIPLS